MPRATNRHDVTKRLRETRDTLFEFQCAGLIALRANVVHHRVAHGDGRRGDGVHYQANYHISRAAVHLRSGYAVTAGEMLRYIATGNTDAHSWRYVRSGRRAFSRDERDDDRVLLIGRRDKLIRGKVDTREAIALAVIVAGKNFRILSRP